MFSGWWLDNRIADMQAEQPSLPRSTGICTNVLYPWQIIPVLKSSYTPQLSLTPCVRVLTTGSTLQNIPGRSLTAETTQKPFLVENIKLRVGEV